MGVPVGGGSGGASGAMERVDFGTRKERARQWQAMLPVESFNGSMILPE